MSFAIKKNMIWKQIPDLATVNRFSKNTLNETLGIELIEVGDDFLRARMPVDARHVQPFRILHGGANVVLAETLGSYASNLMLEKGSGKMPVGVEINANHLASVPEGGAVVGTVRAVRTGRNIHVWNIEIHDESGKLSCVSRITVAIVDRKG